MGDGKIFTHQALLPFPPLIARSREEALQELERPCGRFLVPLSIEERFRLFVSRELDKSDSLGNVTAVIAPGVPLNWQVLLRYLHQQGVITEPHFIFGRYPNDLPKMYGAELRAKPERHQTDGHLSSQYGYASSRDIETVLSKTLGELLERFFLTLYKRDSLTRASFTELSLRRTHVLNIFALNSFLTWQQKKTPRLARDANAPLYWVKGETIDGKPAYIPAQLVFWNYDHRHDTQEPIFAHATTNGAAGHFTKEEAILSGLLENIERDGFLIYWLNGISPYVIDVSSTEHEELQIFLTSIKRYGLDIYFLDTTTDVGIPTATCVLIDARAEEPIYVACAASGFNLEETILKSGYEALSVMQHGAQREKFSLPEPYEPFTDSSIGRSERTALWKGKKMAERFSFFLRGGRRTHAEFLAGVPQYLTLTARLDFILKRLRAMGDGYEVYLYEAKHEVLSVLGYRVIQTLVPQLFPMYLNEHLVTLDSKRLREVPGKIGFKAAEKLNPWPHPFP